MRDKKNPGDTYNYKEHVYADPVALRKEIEEDKQKNATTRAKPNIKKYQKPESPPPVPSGPRGERGARDSPYAELAKKSNVQKSSVRELGSLFGETRAGRAETPGDLPPSSPPAPPVPEVTESRNILEETNSLLGNPIEISKNDTAMNILGDMATSEGISVPVEDATEPNSAEGQVEVTGNLNTDSEVSPPFEASSPEPGADEPEVVIDVRINSKAGIDIGAEIPTATSDADGAHDDGGVRFIRSVKRDSLAEDTSDTGPPNTAAEPATVGDSSRSAPSKREQGSKTAEPATGNSSRSAPSKREHGSETGSGSSGSTKRKKKDVESGFHPDNHLRRNLIVVSLFLLIVLILITIAVVILVNYTQFF